MTTTIKDILLHMPIMAFAFLPFIGPAISALAGLFGGRKQQQEQTNTSTTDSTTEQILSPEQKLLQDNFIKGLVDRYEKSTDLSGYTAGGLQEINRSADARSKILNNVIASRGLSYSPVAATAQIQQENSRLSDGVNFLNQIPLLSRQLQGESLNDLMRGFSTLPTTTRTSGTTTQRGTNLVPGNMTGGFLSGLGQGLYAPFNKQGQSVIDLLPGLFGKG